MYCESYAYFIVLIPRLSVTHTFCLHFYFLVSRPGMGGSAFPSISFLFICGRAKCLPRDQQSVGSRVPVLQLQSAEVSRTVTSSFERRWTISGC